MWSRREFGCITRDKVRKATKWMNLLYPYFLCPATLERILSLFASEGEGEWTAPEYVIVLLRQPLAVWKNSVVH